MIGKLVRHIKFDAIGIVISHFQWSEIEEGYKVKFLKPVDTSKYAGYPSVMAGINSAVSNFEDNFEEVKNESR